MIFKTFDSKIDKWTSKIGIFGKSFNELGTAVNEAFKSVINNFDNFDENIGFWGSLKNNLFSKQSDKDWIKNSFGDIISKENIDNYIAELDLDSAKEKLQGIFDWQENIKSNDQTWQDYFNTLDDGEDYIKNIIKNTKDLSKLEGQDLVDACNEAREAIINHNHELQNMSFSAKASKVALQALATVGNMVLFAFASKGIELFVSWIDKLANASTYAAENAEALSSAMNISISSMSGNVSKLSDLNDEYQELSQGVNRLGENVNLSTDDYNRYKDIISQISDIMPNLTTYFNAQGEKIAFAKGQLSDLNKEYDNYIQNQAIKYVSDGDEEGHKIQDILDNYDYNKYEDLNGFQKFWSNLKNNLGFVDEKNFTAKEIINELENLRTKESTQEIYEYLQSYDKNFYGKPDLNQRDSAVKYMLLNELGLSGKDTKEILEMTEADYNALMQSIIAYIDDYNTKITSDMNDVRTSLLMQTYSKNDYWEQDEDVQNDIISFLSAIDSDVWEALNIKTEHDMSKFVNNIIDSMSNNTGEFADAWNNLFNPELTNLSVDEYVQQINNLLKIICDTLGLDEENGVQILKVAFGFDDVDNSYKKLQNSFRKITDDHGITNREEYDYLIENTKELTFKQIDLWLESTKGAKNAAQAIEMYKAKLLEVQESADDKPLFPTSQTISDLEDLNKELDNLGNAIAKLDSEGNFDLGNLDSIADYFLGLKDVSYDAEAVNSALKSLADPKTSLEEQAYAVNTLADQYLKTSGILDQLTEENAKLMEFQLERMGISNADKIVEETLNDTLQTQAELESTLAQYKSIVTGETLTLTTVTAQEILNLFAENKITSETATQMAIMAIKKQLVNNNTLDTTADINNLIELCKVLGSSTSALDTYNRVKNGANGMPSDVVESYRKQAEQELQNAIKTGENALANSIPKVQYDGGSVVADLLKDTGSAAAQAQDNYEELFDFFERRVNVLNDALELLNANLENVVGSDAKNLLIDVKIGINKESVNNYTDALLMYQQKALEALSKVPENLQSITVDGSVSMTNFVGSENEEIVNAIKDYQKWSDKVSDCQQELAKLKETIRQLELDKFNNIVEDFTDRLDISTNAQDFINKQIDLFKEAGQVIGKGFYEGLIKESEGQLSILEAEKQALMNELNAGLAAGTIEAGTDEWLEMVSALGKVDGSILDCKKDIEEFNNSIQGLHWDIVDRIQDNFSNLSDEISNLVGLISDADVSDKEGIWSPKGLAQLGLYAQEYERAVYSSQMYADEIEKLNQAYMQGNYSATEYADKLSELKKAQWNEINASKDAKDAIVDLNKARIDMMVKGIEEEIDAMKELTDAKINALGVEKDLNDYRNSLTEKNKSITDLERQIAAMQNDTTAASVARRKNLEEQLAEAKRELADFEYEHSIEVQKETLNQQYEDFETEKNNEITALQNTLTQQETLIANSFETVKQNAATIGNEISLIASNHGIKISESLTTAWQSGNDAIASYGMTLSTGESQFVISLNNMVTSTYSLQEQADMTAVSLANMYNTNSSKLQSDLVNSYYCIANVNTATQTLQASLVSTLDRGYDVSSLVNQIDSVGNSAEYAADKVGALMSALTASNNAEHKNGFDENYTEMRTTPGYGSSTPKFNQAWVPSNFQLNLRKYAKGGIVTKDDSNPLNAIAKSVGEDTLIAAKDGEGILTPVQTTEFMKLTANMEAFNSIMPKPLVNPPLTNIPVVQKTQPYVQIHYDNLVQVQGDVNNSNIRQMESIVNNAVDRQFNQFNSELYKRGVR